MCFFLSHSFVALAICFGSLSCWNTHPRPIFSVLAKARRFSLKLSLYLAPSIHPSTQCSHPVPLGEEQLQRIMFPSLCLMVGMVFFGFKSAFYFFQTWQVELMPKSSILVSSDSIIFSNPPLNHPGAYLQF